MSKQGEPRVYVVAQCSLLICSQILDVTAAFYQKEMNKEDKSNFYDRSAAQKSSTFP